jgi:hypothetical protein
MFDKLFNKIKTDVETWIDIGFNEVVVEVIERLTPPEPDGDFSLIRRFGIEDRPITMGGMKIDRNSWRIEANDNGRDRLVTLIKIDRVANSPEVLLCFRARIRAENIGQPIQIQFVIKGQIDFFWIVTPDDTEISKSVGSPIDNEWKTYETYYHCTSRNYPSEISVNLNCEGTGIVWIESAELLQAPVKCSTPA